MENGKLKMGLLAILAELQCSYRAKRVGERATIPG
jgi:hypothetical protein